MSHRRPGGYLARGLAAAPQRVPEPNARHLKDSFGCRRMTAQGQARGRAGAARPQLRCPGTAWLLTRAAAASNATWRRPQIAARLPQPAVRARVIQQTCVYPHMGYTA